MLIIIVSPFSSCSVLTVTRSLVKLRHFQSVSHACLSAAFVNISMCVDQLTEHRYTYSKFSLAMPCLYWDYKEYTMYLEITRNWI